MCEGSKVTVFRKVMFEACKSTADLTM